MNFTAFEFSSDYLKWAVPKEKMKLQRRISDVAFFFLRIEWDIVLLSQNFCHVFLGSLIFWISFLDVYDLHFIVAVVSIWSIVRPWSFTYFHYLCSYDKADYWWHKQIILRLFCSVHWLITVFVILEGQVIDTDTTNILIRSLQLSKQKNEAKDVGSRTPGESSKGKRYIALMTSLQYWTSFLQCTMFSFRVSINSFRLFSSWHGYLWTEHVPPETFLIK